MNHFCSQDLSTRRHVHSHCLEELYLAVRIVECLCASREFVEERISDQDYVGSNWNFVSPWMAARVLQPLLITQHAVSSIRFAAKPMKDLSSCCRPTGDATAVLDWRHFAPSIAFSKGTLVLVLAYASRRQLNW